MSVIFSNKPFSDKVYLGFATRLRAVFGKLINFLLGIANRDAEKIFSRNAICKVGTQLRTTAFFLRLRVYIRLAVWVNRSTRAFFSHLVFFLRLATLGLGRVGLLHLCGLVAPAHAERHQSDDEEGGRRRRRDNGQDEQVEVGATREEGACDIILHEEK